MTHDNHLDSCSCWYRNQKDVGFLCHHRYKGGWNDNRWLYERSATTLRRYTRIQVCQYVRCRVILYTHSRFRHLSTILSMNFYEPYSYGDFTKTIPNSRLERLHNPEYYNGKGTTSDTNSHRNISCSITLNDLDRNG